MITLAANDQLIPIILLETLDDQLLVSFGQHFSSARLVIKCSPDHTRLPASHITLVTDHLMMIGNSTATKLNPRIVSCAHQFGIQTQLEVRIDIFRTQEFIAGDGLVEGTCYDCSLLHRKHVRFTFPSGKCLTIEERDKSRLNCQQSMRISHGQDSQQQHRTYAKSWHLKSLSLEL